MYEFLNKTIIFGVPIAFLFIPLMVSAYTLLCGVFLFLIDFMKFKNLEKKKSQAKAEIKQIALQNSTEYILKDFFKLDIHKYGDNKHMNVKEFIGICILHNQSKNMYYIKKSVHVNKQIIQQFMGKGNPSVYDDYKHGDEFTVRALNIKNCSYFNLSDLERDMVIAFESHERGYN